MSESTLEGSAIATNSLDKAKEKPKSTLFSSQKKPFKKKELVQMFRSLASMLRAQLRTADAIKYYEHGHPSKDMVGSLNQICGDINKGVPVHSAFKRSERFDEMTIGLIQAGGDTGQLDTAFAELGKRIKNEIHFRKKIRKTAEAESEEAFHASTDVVAMRELMREIGLVSDCHRHQNQQRSTAIIRQLFRLWRTRVQLARGVKRWILKLCAQRSNC